MAANSRHSCWCVSPASIVGRFHERVPSGSHTQTSLVRRHVWRLQWLASVPRPLHNHPLVSLRRKLRAIVLHTTQTARYALLQCPVDAHAVHEWRLLRYHTVTNQQTSHRNDQFSSEQVLMIDSFGYTCNNVVLTKEYKLTRSTLRLKQIKIHWRGFTRSCSACYSDALRWASTSASATSSA